MTKRFEGRLAVITGAGGGLGRALALGFAGEGADLILTDVAPAKLEETAELARAEGSTVDTQVFDLGDEAAIQTFGAEACAAHPRIDILYNNAGIAYGEINGMIDAIGQAKWLHFLSINSVSPLLVALALRPSLAAAKGVILNQSSMASNVPASIYGVTKATLNSMTFGMAHIFGKEGIRVNAIEPGIMETPANREAIPAENYARIQATQLLDLHGNAEDIVKLGIFLASDDARFITREVISCDGGSSIRGWRH